MRRRSRPAVGDVVEIPLPGGRYAYGRVLRDASIAIYRSLRNQPGAPPAGSRDFLFIVGIYDDVLMKLSVVGQDPSETADDEWPPPYRIEDPITGRMSIYDRGEITSATASECELLEPAAVWNLDQIVRRIEAESPPVDDRR